MLVGGMDIPKGVERSTCRTSEDYYITVVGDYKIHATALMPKIPFGEAKVTKDSYDPSIFVNYCPNHAAPIHRPPKYPVGSVCIDFPKPPLIETQNFLTTHYIGRAPYDFYGPKTPKGEEFQLICRGGDTSYAERYFGTEGAIIGNNTGANDLFTQPR